MFSEAGFSIRSVDLTQLSVEATEGGKLSSALGCSAGSARQGEEASTADTVLQGIFHQVALTSLVDCEFLPIIGLNTADLGRHNGVSGCIYLIF